jgi:hypothetical protein
VVVFVAAVALGSYVSAQDKPAAPKPLYTAAEMRKHVRGIAAGGAPVSADTPVCILSDKTVHRVNTTATIAGKAYRCVTVLDENLEPAGTAWTPVQ